MNSCDSLSNRSQRTDSGQYLKSEAKHQFGSPHSTELSNSQRETNNAAECSGQHQKRRTCANRRFRLAAPDTPQQPGRSCCISTTCRGTQTHNGHGQPDSSREAAVLLRQAGIRSPAASINRVTPVSCMKRKALVRRLHFVVFYCVDYFLSIWSAAETNYQRATVSNIFKCGFSMIAKFSPRKSTVRARPIADNCHNPQTNSQAA